MKNTGFTFMEIVVSIIVIIFILVEMNVIFGVGIRNNRKAERIYTATGLGQELMEQIKSKEFGNVVSIAPVDIGGFIRRADVTDDYQGNADRKLVVVTVTGPDIAPVILKCIETDPA